jgi:hypothetical protein
VTKVSTKWSIQRVREKRAKEEQQKNENNQ